MWNPEQYLKFAQPRLRPAVDLLMHVTVDSPEAVVDLGCGTGNVTKLLAERWPAGSITGIDESKEMLAQAAKLFPTIRWQQSNIAEWHANRSVDVVFSNAALHWLPNHSSLFPTLARALRPGGTLAIQMPRNFLAPSHALIADTVHAGSWRTKLNDLIRPPPVADGRFYQQLLAPFCSDMEIWETEYLHILTGPDPVKEWVKGTWLKQFLDKLDPTERVPFETDYARRLRDAYPSQRDGTTLFPFRRLFIVARVR